jgi:GDP-L-fucose synthase
MKILVLGGHGFLGKHVVEILSKSGHTAIPVSRKEGVDLQNYEITKRCFTEINPSVIINCAAHVGSVHYVNKFAADVINDNVQIALNVYRALSEVLPNALIINPLSNCSYPGDANIHYEPDWWKGEVHESVFSYGNSKKIIYVLSQCYKKQYGINSINYLVPNAFGPGDYLDPNKVHALNGMIIRMIQAKRNNIEQFEIWGSGSPIREWGFIKDIAQILTQSVNLQDSQIYPVNIAQNKGYSIKQSAEIISELLGYKGEIKYNLNYQDGAPVKILDDKKFRELFPDFKFIAHKDGIKETIEYYNAIL